MTRSIRELIEKHRNSIPRSTASGPVGGVDDDEPLEIPSTLAFTPPHAGRAIGAAGELRCRFVWPLSDECSLDVRATWDELRLNVDYSVSGDPPDGELWFGLRKGPGGIDAWIWLNLGPIRSGTTSVDGASAVDFVATRDQWSVCFHCEPILAD